MATTKISLDRSHPQAGVGFDWSTLDWDEIFEIDPPVKISREYQSPEARNSPDA